MTAEPSTDTQHGLVLNCDDRCADPEMHDYYMAGGGFRWKRPRVVVYTPADKVPRFTLNRYPHNVIGVAVVVFGRCWALTWKGSKR